jgi:diacylglycerol kinase (ATP)
MTGKKPTGIDRIIKAAGYSMAGLKAAWKHEAAFRQELCALAVLLPLGFFLGHNGLERAMLISSGMMVLVTELLNSAIEAVVDRTGLEHHPLAKRAKDLGSAAVFISITIVIIIWVLILI